MNDEMLSLIPEDYKNLYKVISDDIISLKDKQANEIDFSETYDDLKDFLKNILDKRCTSRDMDEIKFFILAFSLEIAKKPVGSFWNELDEELDITGENKTRLNNLIRNSLWNLMKSLNMEPSVGMRGNTKTRLVIGTLRMKVESDPSFLHDATQFFIYYYKNHKGLEIGTIIKNYDKCEKYKDNNDKKEQIIVIVQKLLAAVDYIKNHGLNYLNDEYKLEALVLNELNIPVKRYTRKRISNLVKEVLNRFTPRGFIKILIENRTKYVTTPHKKEIMGSELKNKKFGYGVYKISGISYYVIPDIRIDLEELKNWKFETIIDCKNLSYYKKNTFFQVSRGDVREFYFESNKFYLWHGNVPIGEEFAIDGKYIKREGFIWKPDLSVQWKHKDNPIQLIIEISKLYCFFRNKSWKELKIKLNEQEKLFTLDKDGFFSEHNIRFGITGKSQNLVLEVFIDNTKIKEKKFSLDEHMLFSVNTRQQIKSYQESSKITKRQFGEDKYYLFSIFNQNDIQFGKSLKSEYLDNFGSYCIYDIKWISDINFKIKIKEYEWRFERKRYIEWWFINNNFIFNSTKEIQVAGNTNLDISKLEENPIIKILNKDHVPIDIIEITESYMNKYFEIDENYLSHFVINGNYLIEKSSIITGLSPDEYILELNIDEIILEKTFYIIPEIQLHWPTILLDNKKSLLKCTSVEKVIMDPKTGKCTDKLEIPLWGKVNYLYNNPINEALKIPQVKNENISAKVTFNLNCQNDKSERKSNLIIKEYSPSPPLSVFGYRLYLRNKNNVTLIYELNYYDIENSILHVFTKSFETVEILLNDSVIFNKQTDSNGNCIFYDLNKLKALCKFSKTIIEIRSYGISEFLEIMWHPRVFRIEHAISEHKKQIKARVYFKGPKKGKINIELENEKLKLDKKIIISNGRNGINDITFDLSKEINDNFLYLISYISSFNGQFLRSKSYTVYNKSKNQVEIRTKNEKIQVTSQKFLDKIIDVSNFVLSKKKAIFHFMIPDGSIQVEFVELLSLINSNIEIIAPNENQVDKFKRISEITCNKSCIHIFKHDIESLEKILNPIKINDIIRHGLGVSSYDLIDNLNKYLPNSDNPIIVIDGQELYKNEREKIFKDCCDKTLIFIERS